MTTGDRPDGSGPDSSEPHGSEPGGTYTLLVVLPAATGIEVGALGAREFPAGWYAYTGSALGSGGFARVERHRELAAGERDTRHWHVDYLLGHRDAALREVVTSPGADIECAVAQRLPSGPVEGFGASDCDCGSHLAHFGTRERALAAVRTAHDAAR
ncbi:GIY-YIG nuclease family protein [Haloglomus halophilum]|uniref:GIY-YIG nuclease family protein n=1 Tax=Haloglomus halophilum TaxID=2962672 RepID=UPI00331367B7